MDSLRSREHRLIWSFWAAAAVALVGGVLPFVVGGTSSRINSVIVPFAIAALALAGCALLHSQGRAVAAALYFVAGLGLVYGVLSMIALPLELAALGTCPAPPAGCTTGLPRPLTSPENTGIGLATGFGVAALFVGFFGLMMVFRRVTATLARPAERLIAPIAQPRPAEAVPAAVGAGTPAAPVSARSENGNAPAVERAELPAHEEEELPELPPHESDPPTS